MNEPTKVYAVSVKFDEDLCLSLRGHAMQEDALPDRVTVLVNGGLTATAVLRGERNDVAERNPTIPHARISGWKADVDLSNFGGDQVEVEVVATYPNGEEQAVGAIDVEVPLPALHGKVLTPAPDELVARGRVGFCVQVAKQSKLHPAGFRVEVDGTQQVRRTLPIVNVDQKAILFSFEVDFSGHDPGPAEVRVQVLCGDGRWRLLSVSPVVVDTEPPVAGVGELTARCTNNGTLHFRGWAISARDTIRRIHLSVNDIEVGLARMGLPQPGVVQQFGLAESTSSGFSQSLALPDELRGAGRLRARATIELRHGDEFALAVDVETPDEIFEPEATAPRPVLADRTRTEFPSRPHLLAFTHSLGLGGGQFWLTELVRRTQGSEADWTVITQDLGPVAEDLQHQGVVVRRVDVPLGDADDYESVVGLLAEWAHGQKFDGVVSNTLSSMFGGDVAQRIGVANVWAVHESFELPVFWDIGFGGQEVCDHVKNRHVEVLASSDVLVFESDLGVEALGPLAQPKRAAYLPWGIDLARVREFLDASGRVSLREKMQWGDDARILMCVGTVEPRKAQISVVNAFLASIDHETKSRLVILGDTDTPYSEAMHDRIRRHPLGDRVHVVSAVTETETFEYYEAADVLVCASDIEGMPRVLIEAMAFGLLCCATNVFGIPSLVAHEHTGLLFEPNDTVALSDCLARVLAMSEEELAAIVSRSTELVWADYDAGLYMDDVMEALRRLAADSEATLSEIGLATRPKSLRPMPES